MVVDLMKPLAELLEEHEACEEGVEWANGYATAAEAWDACQRPDWLLWSLERIGWRDDRLLRLFACWCVRNTPLADGRVVWDLLTDARSRNAVEVAERLAIGEADKKALTAASAAASAAAKAAASAVAWAAASAAAASAAAKAAASAAAKAAASAAAWAAASAAPRAAAWAAAWAAPSAAARAAAWAAQSSEIKRLIDNPFRTGGPST